MTEADWKGTEYLAWMDGLPHPEWDRIEARIALQSPQPEHRAAWESVGRLWLADLGDALGRYQILESEHFQVLAPVGGDGPRLLGYAERSRSALLVGFRGVTRFELPGKQVVVLFDTPDEYYRYIARFYPEGEFGGSAGVHIRDGYPHVALTGKLGWALDICLAHELTHVSLLHLAMPQWLEEGLAQMVEYDIATRAPLLVTTELADRHKRYWQASRLSNFWHGGGFSKRGEVQELSYQLAEILVRLLFDEFRPRWFGWVQEPRDRLLTFLKAAEQPDGGEAACREHLGFGLADLASKFLGPSTSGNG